MREREMLFSPSGSRSSINETRTVGLQEVIKNSDHTSLNAKTTHFTKNSSYNESLFLVLIIFPGISVRSFVARANIFE